MPYFTTAELRALPDLEDGVRFPDARLTAAHDWIVSVIERTCGTSFISTPVTETLNGSGREALFPTRPFIQAVSAVTLDGTAFTAGEVAALIVQHGALYRPSAATWPATSRANVTVTYTAGYSTTVPADLKEAAMRAARNWLLTSHSWSGVDTRATSITNDFGNVNLAVAGPDRPTGLPDVDAVISAWAQRVHVPRVS